MAADLTTGNLFLTGGLQSGSSKADIWQYMLGEGWTNMSALGGRVPTGRHGHASVYANNEFGSRVYVYAGESAVPHTSPALLGDLWAFDVENKFWYEMVSFNPPPEPRKDAAMVLDVEHKHYRIYVFGGQIYRNHEYTYLDDLWQYDLSTNKNTWGGDWTQISCSSKLCPPGRSASGIGLLNGRIALFGGLNNKGESNDLWFTDTKDSGIWELEAFAKTVLAPSPRAHACFGWEWSNEFVYVLTGGGSARVYEDIWRFRPGETTVWEDIEATPDPRVKPNELRPETGMPRRREGAACVLANSQFVLYGGLDRDLEVMGDMWMYDFTVPDEVLEGGAEGAEGGEQAALHATRHHHYSVSHLHHRQI
eukprot:c18096_g1_i1.p1 GENE.c18096_g1_i1~~c18096_g1_i1.p1  ORF type:complete len:398 (+),score=74.08 c18096_g1_i1:100-1194(+)